MHSHTSITLVALGAVAALTASCNTGLAGPNGDVAAIQLTAAADTAFALGDTVPFHATATDKSGATLSDVTYTWTSSAPDVATVSNDGVVIAVGNGVTTIQAAVNGVTGSAPLTVQQVAVGLTIELTHDTIAAIGHTVQATAQPADARGNPLGAVNATWTSSNPAVATVDDGGLVRGIANGQAMISAEAAGIRGSVIVTMHQLVAAIVRLNLVQTYLSGTAGNLITPAVLELRDSAGHLLAADSSTPVRALISAGAGTLAGSTIMPVTGGRVTFDSLSVEGLAGDRTMTFAVRDTSPRTSVPLYIYPGPAAKVYGVSPTSQTAPAGTTLEIPFKVKVVDAFGNPIRGVSVLWTLLAGSGVVDSPVTATDNYGIALTTYVLSSSVRVDTVGAVVDNLPGSPVLFSGTATTPSATPVGQQ